MLSPLPPSSGLLWFSFLYSVLLQQGFSASALLTLGAGPFYVLGDCPVYWEVFSSTPGLYSLDACSICPPPPIHDNQKRLQTLSNVLWGVTLTLVENYCSVGLEVLQYIYSLISDLTRSNVNYEQWKDVRTLNFVTPFPSKNPLPFDILVHPVVNSQSLLLLYFMWYCCILYVGFDLNTCSPFPSLSIPSNFFFLFVKNNFFRFFWLVSLEMNSFAFLKLSLCYPYSWAVVYLRVFPS